MIRDAAWLPDAPNAELYPPAATRQRLDDQLTGDLAAASARVAAGPVSPRLDRDKLARDLAAFDFETPQALEDMMAWTIAQLEHGVVHIPHPRYFGLFNPAAAFPAQMADRIVASFNPQLASAVTSPAATAIEAHVIGAMARRAGLPPAATGHFTSGGSEANATALICALTRAAPQFAEHGVRAFSGPPVFYVSAECHLAWLKIAHIAGIGRAGARLVPTDGSGRMDLRAMAGMMAADTSAGCVPVMIVATAGTTNAGMIDPLADCAHMAAGLGAWCHVDAAWGGALLVSDRLRGALAGLELADSITIDAHKWLAATMGCGMFLAREPATLTAAFHVAASFMPPSGLSVDPYTTSMQWSRRFLGLRLFLSLASAGWQGYGQHVERSVALAAFIGDELAARGWRIANTSTAAVLCLEPPKGGAGARQIVSSVVAEGSAWVSVTKFEGRDYVRVCVTHGQTSKADALALVRALDAACHS